MRQIKTILLLLFISMLGHGCAVTSYSALEEIPNVATTDYYGKVKMIQAGMSKADIRAVLGEPAFTRGVSDVWLPFPGEKYNQIKVIYVDGVAVRATWASLSKNFHHLIFG